MDSMDIKTISEQIAQSPKNHNLYLQRGVLYYKMADMTSAYNDFIMALELSPDSSEAKHYLSLTGAVMNFEYKEPLNV